MRLSRRRLLPLEPTDSPETCMSRLIAAAPREEMDRRWTLVRDRLKARQADCLIVVGQSNELDGAVRWLTDAGITYRKVVLFHADDLMTVMEHGAAGQVRKLDGGAEGYPGVGESIAFATFASVDYTQVYEAQRVCEIVRARGYRRVALYHPMALSYGFLRCLQTTLDDVEFIDETDFLDRAKALKSPREIEALEKSAAIQDAVFQKTIEHIRPGMKEYEVSAFAFYQARLMGGYYGISLTGSGAPGDPAFMRGYEQQGRTLQAGDNMCLLVENGGPGGYYMELGRPLCLGKAGPELREAFDIALAAQDFTLSLLKPGVKAADVYAQYTEHLQARGLPPEMRLYAHGQGHDLIERPLIRQDETMTLEAGMCLAVHPGLVKRGAFAFTCDNVIIEKDGPRIVHKTPRRLFELDV